MSSALLRGWIVSSWKRYFVYSFFLATGVVLQAESVADDEPGPRSDTVVLSDNLEMVSSEKSNHFYFTDNVIVKGNFLYATSDKMEVVSSRQAGSEGAAIGQIGAVQRIQLDGSVEIKQAGRRATSDSAVIIPAKGEVTLRGNATVYDSEGTVNGEEIVLNRSERRAIVKGSGNNRPKVTLPGLQDMSFRGDPEPAPAKSETANEDNTSTEAAAE